MPLAAKRIIFFVPPSVSIMDLTGPAHVFHGLRNYTDSLEILYCSVVKEVVSTASLSMTNFTDLKKIDPVEGDIIFIPGADYNLMISDSFKKLMLPFNEWLNKANSNKAKIASVCTGAFILGDAGMLTNKIVTTHWRFVDRLQESFPFAKVNKDVLFVKDTNLYSSAGVSTGIDLALFMIEEIYGIKTATEISKELVVYIRRSADNPQESIYLQHRNHIQSDIHKVQDYVIANLNQKMRLSELAKIAYMSERNFTRQFKKTIGVSVLSYINELRKERAVTLMNNSDLTMKKVATEVGLKSSNQLRNIINQ